MHRESASLSELKTTESTGIPMKEYFTNKTLKIHAYHEQTAIRGRFNGIRVVSEKK